MNKIKENRFINYMNGKMNMKVFYVLIIGIFVLAMFISVFFGALDTDMSFLIASGNEIFENGIPYKNVWCMDHNASIVLQQWLYCVIIATFHKLGVMGLFLLSIITFSIFVLLVKAFFKVKGISNNRIYFLYLCMMAAYSAYLFKVRPQTVTLIIMLLECYGLEKYKATSKSRWLILVPLSMLLEINLHASMWPMHFAMLLCYVVPPVFKGIEDTSIVKMGKKPLIISLICMIAVMFANPYGIDGIMYIVRSMSSGSLDALSIAELATPTYFSPTTVTLLVLVAGCIILWKIKKLDSVTLYMCLGISFLSILKLRNNMFNSIPLLYVCLKLANAYESQDKFVIDWQKDIKRYLYPFFALTYVMLFFMIVSLFNNIVGTDKTYAVLKTGDKVEIVQHFNKFNYDKDFALIEEYIEKNDCYHDKIFTGFNTGAYMEYLGCDNVFIDARPEIYDRHLNGSNDFIQEYTSIVIPSSYSAGLCDLSKSSENYKDFLKKFTEKYDFDYVVIDARLEEVVYGMYLDSRVDYEMVEDVSTATYYFYRKIK